MGRESWAGRRSTPFQLTANFTRVALSLLMHVCGLDGEAQSEAEAGCRIPHSLALCSKPVQRGTAPQPKAVKKEFQALPAPPVLRKDSSISQKRLSFVTPCSSSKSPETSSQHNVLWLQHRFQSHSAWFKSRLRNNQTWAHYLIPLCLRSLPSGVGIRASTT